MKELRDDRGLRVLNRGRVLRSKFSNVIFDVANNGTVANINYLSGALTRITIIFLNYLTGALTRLTTISINYLCGALTELLLLSLTTCLVL